MTARRRYSNAGRGPRINTERPNKYPATCAICDQEMAAGAGVVRWDGKTWVPFHRAPRWHGSPVSGAWVGGCPTAADEVTA